jgi:uncharacterized caspase-like protein
MSAPVDAMTERKRIMRKWLGMAVAGLVALACAATAQAETKYAVCVGLNEYEEISSLSGCVNDANYFYTNLVARGGWQKSNMTLLRDSAATKNAIRRAVSNYAAKAVSGDTFIYQQSSHGGQKSGKNTYLCVYDEVYEDDSTAYNDYEIAADMASFAAGVKVVVIVDACHSGGLFKDAASAKVPFNLAERVTEIMNADRAARLARGERGIEKKLSASEIGWVTAADYNQSSLDGGYYDSNKWMSNPNSKGKVMGGVFLGAFTWGWWDGSADTRSGYGNNDGYADPYECWRAGYVICTNKSLQGSDAFTPQCTNITVLRSVELGWVGDEKPSGVRFASIPAQTATVGQTLNYSVVATNSDGSTGKITYSVSSSTAPSGSYSVNATSGAFAFTPATDGTFEFAFLATNATAGTFGKATMTVTAALTAPAGLSNSGITANSFTANWDPVTGAASYLLDVSSEPFGAKAARDDAILDENFDNLPASTADQADKLDTYLSGSGWTGSRVFGENGGAKLGSSKANGWIATPALDLSAGGTLSFSPLMYKTESETFLVSIVSGGQETSIGSVAAGGESAEFAIPPADASTKVKIATSSKRAIIDNLVITAGGGADVLANQPVDGTSYAIEGLETATYYWRVRAVGNAKGPYSETEEVTLKSDPTAPPSIRPIADIDITVGETATATVKVSAPDEAPVTSLTITAGDATATLVDGEFSFTPAAPGKYDFTITAVNANDSASISFTVTATLAAPEAPTASVVGSSSFTATWTAIPGASGYELVVIEGQGGSSGGGGGSGSGDFALVTSADGLTAGEYVILAENADSAMNNTCSATASGYFSCTEVPVTDSGISTEEASIIWTLSGNASSCTLFNSAAGKYVNPSTSKAAAGWSDTASGSWALSMSDGIVSVANAASTSWKLQYNSNTPRFTTYNSTQKDLRFFRRDGAKSIAKAVGDVVFSNNVGNVVSCEVTGLQPLTEYTFAFRAIAGEETTDWSPSASVKTTEGPSAPMWSEIPAQAAAVDYPYSIDLSAYVSGSPTPTLTLVSGDAKLSGTVLGFTPATAGTYSFTVSAANGVGEAAGVTFAVEATEHQPTKYAVCVGINEYKEISGLSGCVNDSIYIESSLIERGGWAAENVVRLNDKNATKAAIRGAIAAVAAKAQAGDTFVYQHSSHGGQFNDTTGEIITNESGKAVFLCVYDEDYDDNTTAYNDYEIAADMAAFNAGVKVAVIVDACHSGGLFKSKEEARAAAASFDLAGRVTAIMDADRARRQARGENVAKTLASSEIGWATACEYYETSYDGGFFHTDEWLTNPSYGDEYWVGDDENGYYNYPSSYKQGGVFTASSAWGWWNGTADADPEAGDNDGFCDVYEFWKAGYEFCSVIGEFWWEKPEYNYYPQCTNIAVLKSVELGWVEDPRIPAPQDPEAPASEVTASSFTAVWQPVEDAVSYNLYVQKKAEADSKDTETPILLQESFEGDGMPAGWTVSDAKAVTLVSSSPYDGTTCVAFSAKDAYLITPQVQDPDSISLWFRRSRDTSDWSLDVSVGPSTDGPWTNLGTIKDATTDWQEFTASVTDSGALFFKLTDTRPSGAKQRYIDFVTITGAAARWVDVPGYSPANVTGTSKEVTGLEMGSEYRFSVTAIDAEGTESAPSERVSVTTAEADTAPIWSVIPEQAAVAGELFTFKPAGYVKASPAATIKVVSSSVADGEYKFEEGILTFTPPSPATYTFEFQASNALGVSNATMTVVAAAAPRYVPELALSNPQAKSFDASWTACTGATSYQLQVATDDQFTTGGGGEGGAFTLVTSAAGFTAGEYVILADGTDCAMNNTYAGTSSKYLSCTDVTVTGNTVSTEEASIIWTLAGDASSCTLFNSDAGKYVNPAATKTVGWADTASGSWTLSVTEDGIVTAANADDTTWVLQYNSGSPRFMCYSSSQKKLRFFRRDAAKSVAKDGGSLVLDTTTPDLAYTVTGLEPETTYFARVRMAEGEWSAVESIKTQSDVPTPPAWLDLPAQTATVGLEFGLDLSSYVTGSPFPTITVDGTVAEGGNWSFTPDEAKTYTFELIATNTQGSDSTTLTVVASPAPAAKYALCVGLNEYDYTAWYEQGWNIGPLKGCANDATYMKKNLTERGGWADADVTLLTNETATKDALRAAIAAVAAKAKAGDTFIYQHSSHGLNNDDPYGTDVALATYAAPYEDFELAEDLAAFADGVKVVIAIDACHSAGMFKKGAAAPAGSFDIAARVSALMDATRAARKARGEDISRNLSSDQVGWITAANYDEESKDGGYYDTDEWLSDEEAEGDVPGGTFLASLTWGWWSGKADVSGTGDGDGWFDAYEGWGFASPVCIEAGFTPQFLNEDVLRSVELGWIGEAAPSEAILFDPVPGASVGIGEEATLTVAAKNADGTTDGITLSIVESPEGAVYDFAGGKLTFTPDEDGLFLFTVQAANATAGTSATKLLGVTAVLPAPVALDASDVDNDSFTANWTGVDAAQGYELQVSTDPNFPEDEPDLVVKEGFDDVTKDVSSLPSGWEFSGTFNIYESDSSSGEAPPSIQLKPNDATLTTPEFKLRRMGGLSFWVKGNGSGTNMTSVLKVEQLVGGEWLELDSFTPATVAGGETKRYDNVDLDATRFRFVMSKPDGAVGNIAIDDVMVLTLPADAAMVLEDEIPAGTTSCAVEDLTPGTTYYYRVRAFANTASAWSETIEVTTTGEKPIPVPELTVDNPRVNPETSIVAFWDCEGATEFHLQVSTDAEFGELVFDEDVTENVCLVTNLTPETTYYARVRALVGERAGDWSEVQTITTAAGGPRIDGIAIDTAAGTFSFTVQEGTSVETATDLLAGDWVPYEGEVGEDGQVSIPMDAPSAYYRLVPSAD